MEPIPRPIIDTCFFFFWKQEPKKEEPNPTQSFLSDLQRVISLFLWQVITILITKSSMEVFLTSNLRGPSKLILHPASIEKSDLFIPFWEHPCQPSKIYSLTNFVWKSRLKFGADFSNTSLFTDRLGRQLTIQFYPEINFIKVVSTIKLSC